MSRDDGRLPAETCRVPTATSRREPQLIVRHTTRPCPFRSLPPPAAPRPSCRLSFDGGGLESVHPPPIGRQRLVGFEGAVVGHPLRYGQWFFRTVPLSR